VAPGSRCARSCEDPSVEACKDFACRSETHRRQPVKSTTRPAGHLWVYGLPPTDEPTRGFESQQNGIQGPGRESTALVNFCTGELRRGILEECLEYPESLEGHAHASFFTHTRKST
jgi:hypothetical protein